MRLRVIFILLLVLFFGWIGIGTVFAAPAPPPTTLVLPLPGPVDYKSGIGGCMTYPDPSNAAAASVTPNSVLSLACAAGIVSKIIEFAIYFLGAVFILFFIYGSIRFILSSGNEKSVAAAKATLTWAVIGTVFIILTFVFFQLVVQVFGIQIIPGLFTFYR